MSERPVLQVGDVLAGKYRIDHVLGEGGMGVVVLAHHLQLEQRVAIKFLRPERLTNEEAVTRFAREARATVKIKSQHVARIFDVGSTERGGIPYMVMEFLDGQDLGQWVAERGPLPLAQAVEFLLQACEALAEAHSLGIIHRDLKPANLFLSQGPDGLPTLKVLDFGISRLMANDQSAEVRMTKTTDVMGSPLYMSPEQMRSARDSDERADVWALGVVLYQVLSGHLPFLGLSLPEVCMKILSEEPTPLRQYRPDVPPQFEQVIRRCLQKRREDRYADMGQLAFALAPFGSSQAGDSLERIAHVLGQSVAAPLASARRARERTRLALALTSLAVLAGLGTAYYIKVRRAVEMSTGAALPIHGVAGAVMHEPSAAPPPMAVLSAAPSPQTDLPSAAPSGGADQPASKVQHRARKVPDSVATPHEAPPPNPASDNAGTSSPRLDVYEQRK